MRFHSLGVLVALMLVACAGPAPTPSAPATEPAARRPDGEYRISSAAGPEQKRLPCNRGQVTPECDLRIYQIMVESFVDADPRAGSGMAYGTSHHRGDLQGVINALDYIRGLGVNAIWLTPVFQTVRDPRQDYWTDLLDGTGYFASNYFQIDPRFGTFRQAKTLVDEAHKRGLYVFFDGVFGHHKPNLVPSPSGLKPVGRPKAVDYPESLPFYKEVATYWIEELRIDGWRLDQANQVPVESWTELRKAVRAVSDKTKYADAAGREVSPLGYMVGEIWSGPEDIARYGYGPAAAPGLVSAFDFPLRYRLVQTLAVEEAYANSGKGGLPAVNLAEGYATHERYPDHAMPNLMLTNHDLVRFGDLIQRGGLAEPDQDAYWARHKAAFAFMAAYSGPITVYYGDEIGQETPLFAAKVPGSYCASQGLCDDHVSRVGALIEGLPPVVGDAPTVLSARQKDLKDHVSRLMRLRREHPALAVGSRTPLLAEDKVYADLKTAGADRVLFLLNIGVEPARVRVAAGLLGSSALKDLLSGAVSRPAADGDYVVELPGLSGRFLGLN